MKIGEVAAQRINLKNVERQVIVKMLDRSLAAINAQYKRFSGESLWVKDLFRSKRFLSGSSLHLFDKRIPDNLFVEKKETIGDIDTQVDKTMFPTVKTWLDGLDKVKLGYLTFIGYKSSAGQLISLWSIDKFNLNIQIDFEMVEFENKFPTAWASFSHSSSWLDVQASIKGVFHKYILRALTRKDMREITLLKGKRETPTQIITGDYTFSVALGLRHKLIKTDIIGVYKELATKDSVYETKLELIFETLFGKLPQNDDLEKFESFVGVLELVKKHYKPKDVENVGLGFAMLLWEESAQGLVRDDPDEDYASKRIAFNLMLNIFQMEQPIEVSTLIEDYYKAYK